MLWSVVDDFCDGFCDGFCDSFCISTLSMITTYFIPPHFAIGSDVAAGSSRSLMGRAGLCVAVRRQ